MRSNPRDPSEAGLEHVHFDSGAGGFIHGCAEIVFLESFSFWIEGTYAAYEVGEVVTV